MTSSSDPRRPWRAGHAVLLVVPFLALALAFTDPPRWLEVVGVLAILLCVGIGSTLLRRRTGAWRPSETLGEARGDGH